MSGHKTRKEERDESRAPQKVPILILDGFQHEKIIPEALDLTRSGAKFRYTKNPHITQGATVTVQLWVGQPPRQVTINAEIKWVQEFGGLVEFGCQFFDSLKEEPILV